MVRDDIILRKAIIFCFFAASILLLPGAQAQTLGPVTGEPIPRFETLRFDTVRMRRGPGREYPIAWLFKRKGLPVKVFHEYGDWRKVSDPFGEIGWIKRTQLSRLRYGLVVEDGTPLRNAADDGARIAVRAQTGVVLRLDACRPDWCHGRAKGYSGWVRKAALFGVSPEEEFEGD